MSIIKSKKNIMVLLLLHIELLLFSLGSICSKLASQYKILSKEFVFYYSIIIINLSVYAIVWQQIIKRIPLSTAYSNKAITVVWGMLWGALFFKEKITWNMILGAAIVIIGVIMVVKSDE